MSVCLELYGDVLLPKRALYIGPFKGKIPCIISEYLAPLHEFQLPGINIVIQGINSIFFAYRILV